MSARTPKLAFEASVTPPRGQIATRSPPIRSFQCFAPCSHRQSRPRSSSRMILGKRGPFIVPSHEAVDKLQRLCPAQERADGAVLVGHVDAPADPHKDAVLV